MFFNTPLECLQYEKCILDWLDVMNNPSYLNQSNGQWYLITKHTEDTKRKIKESNTGIPRPKWSEERKRAFSEKMKGRKFTEEHKQKIAEASKTRKHSEETKEKLRQKSIGRGHTEETKAKMSESHMGIKPWHAGKTLTDEQKKNYRSEARTKALNDARKKSIVASIGVLHSEETKKKQREGIKDFWKNNPEVVKERNKKISENKDRAMNISASKLGSRKMIHPNLPKAKMIKPDQFDQYLQDGWQFKV